MICVRYPTGLVLEHEQATSFHVHPDTLVITILRGGHTLAVIQPTAGVLVEDEPPSRVIMPRDQEGVIRQ